MSTLVRMRSVLKNRKGQLKIASLLNKPKTQQLGDNLLKVILKWSWETRFQCLNSIEPALPRKIKWVAVLSSSLSFLTSAQSKRCRWTQRQQSDKSKQIKKWKELLWQASKIHHPSIPLQRRLSRISSLHLFYNSYEWDLSNALQFSVLVKST